MNWNTILEIDKKEIDTSFNNFLLTFNNLLQQHATLKKLPNKEIKTFKKPWITTGILKSIDKKIKQKIYQNKKCCQKRRIV